MTKLEIAVKDQKLRVDVGAFNAKSANNPWAANVTYVDGKIKMEFDGKFTPDPVTGGVIRMAVKSNIIAVGQKHKFNQNNTFTKYYRIHNVNSVSEPRITEMTRNEVIDLFENPESDPEILAMEEIEQDQCFPVEPKVEEKEINAGKIDRICDWDKNEIGDLFTPYVQYSDEKRDIRCHTEPPEEKEGYAIKRFATQCEVDEFYFSKWEKYVDEEHYEVSPEVWEVCYDDSQRYICKPEFGKLCVLQSERSHDSSYEEFETKKEALAFFRSKKELYRKSAIRNSPGSIFVEGVECGYAVIDDLKRKDVSLPHGCNIFEPVPKNDYHLSFYDEDDIRWHPTRESAEEDYRKTKEYYYSSEEKNGTK